MSGQEHSVMYPIDLLKVCIYNTGNMDVAGC